MDINMLIFLYSSRHVFDGLPHYTSPKQIISDFKRDHFSDAEGFVTKHIPNELIETHLDEMADAISEIVKMKAIITPLNQGTST